MSQTRNSLLCPNCRKLISRDEPGCPYCGLKNPGAGWKSNTLVSRLMHPEQIIRTILYTCVGMYIISLLLNQMGLKMSSGPFSFLTPDNRSLLLLGATGTVPIIKLGRWWSLISANYLHGNLLHILFNMIALRQIGPLVVKEYGPYRMFSIYTIGGVAGYLVSFLAGIPFTIGASAAVCSLIGAAIFYGKRRGGLYGQAIYRQLGGWAISIFIFGFLVPGINNWAHGGGMVAGAALGFVLGYNDLKRENFTHKTMAGGLLLITAATLLWAIFSSLFYY